MNEWILERDNIPRAKNSIPICLTDTTLNKKLYLDILATRSAFCFARLTSFSWHTEQLYVIFIKKDSWIAKLRTKPHQDVLGIAYEPGFIRSLAENFPSSYYELVCQAQG